MIGDITTVGDVQPVGRLAVRSLIAGGVCASANYHARTPELTATTSTSSAVIPARSIAAVTGRHIDRYEMLQSLVSQILGSLAELRENADQILAEYRGRCALTGRRVTFRVGDKIVGGDCVGVTDQGELAIDTIAGRIHLRSGEASLVGIDRGNSSPA